jgi:hypothetical protein
VSHPIYVLRIGLGALAAMPERKGFQPPETSFSSSQRKLGSNDFLAERHWIPAFAGMTVLVFW